jgi:hypothetical protein
MTTFAAGSQHALQYITEVTMGTTPSTPQMIALRNTSCTLDLTKDNFASGEIRSDRMISDMRLGVQKVAGDIGFELSYKEFDTLLESALFGAWNVDVLKAGVTPKYMTFERQFTDITKYRVFRGCVVDKLSLSIKPNSMITGTFSLIGIDNVNNNTPLDASPTASQTNSPLDSFTGTLTEGGVAIATVTGIDLTLNNGVTPALVVGSTKAAALVPQRIDLTGSIDAYFPDLTLLNKFINETESSLSIVLGNGATKSYTLLIPRIKFTGGETPLSGEGPIVLKMPFQALLDSSSTNTNFQITRTAT